MMLGHCLLFIHFISDDDDFFHTMTYLVYIIEMSFHALDSDIFVCFGRLGFQNFRECAFTLLAYQPVF